MRYDYLLMMLQKELAMFGTFIPDMDESENFFKIIKIIREFNLREMAEIEIKPETKRTPEDKRKREQYRGKLPKVMDQFISLKNQLLNEFPDILHTLNRITSRFVGYARFNNGAAFEKYSGQYFVQMQQAYEEYARRFRDKDEKEVPEVPDEFCCPITLGLMEDPVTAADGKTYERPAITDWLREHSTSPMTNLELPNKTLTPNTKLKERIEAYKAGLQKPAEPEIPEKAQEMVGSCEPFQQRVGGKRENGVVTPYRGQQKEKLPQCPVGRPSFFVVDSGKEEQVRIVMLGSSDADKALRAELVKNGLCEAEQFLGEDMMRGDLPSINGVKVKVIADYRLPLLPLFGINLYYYYQGDAYFIVVDLACRNGSWRQNVQRNLEEIRFVCQDWKSANKPFVIVGVLKPNQLQYVCSKELQELADSSRVLYREVRLIHAVSAQAVFKEVASKIITGKLLVQRKQDVACCVKPLGNKKDDGNRGFLSRFLHRHP
jgi:hypothetical protein